MRRFAQGALAWLAGLVRRRNSSEGDARPRRPERWAARKYQALVMPLPPAGSSDAKAPLPWSAMRAVVRAQDHRTRDGRLFTALVTSWGGPQQPGNTHVIATMDVVGPHPDDCLAVGDSFTLWRGDDLASGVITRRLFV
jgi:hypothetical protein